MRYFIAGLGYVSDSAQLVIDGVTHPKGWLQHVSPEERAAVGAIPPPPYDSTTQVLESPPEGWHVRDLTQAELDARAAAAQQSREQAVAQAVEDMWRQSWERWGEKQLAVVDRTTLLAWASSGRLNDTGIQMWQDIIDWHDNLFDNHYPVAKQAIIDAGGWVEPDWDSWPPCPHAFLDFVPQRKM